MPRSKRQTKPVFHSGAQSLISPWIDFLCVGGISIAVMLGLLVYIAWRGPTPDQEMFVGSFLIMQALINWPHFMASYRLLYTPRSNIKRYPFAAIYIPALLILLAALALYFGQPDSAAGFTWHLQQDTVYLIWLVAAIYLAWHYTGQAWGMMASFSFLADIKLNQQERLLLRSGLRVLLIWHVVWGAQDLPPAWLGSLGSYLPGLLNLVSFLVIVFFAIGVYTLIHVWQRTGRRPTPQMLAPWLAVYLWYLVLYWEPNAFIFVQLSHALQYLIFPLRIELNRRGYNQLTVDSGKQLLWSSRYYLLLVVAGIIIFYGPEQLTNPGGQVYTVAILVSSLVAIHHYFVDGCIWKLSNQTVKQELFAHLSRR